MKIHSPTLAIDENDPFKHALIARKAFAESLTEPFFKLSPTPTSTVT
jgi:hypothetical protein